MTEKKFCFISCSCYFLAPIVSNMGLPIIFSIVSFFFLGAIMIKMFINRIYIKFYPLCILSFFGGSLVAICVHVVWR